MNDGIQITTERLILTVPGPEDAERLARYAVENREHLAPWEPARDEAYYQAAYWRNEGESARREFARGESLRLILSLRPAPQGPIIGLCNFRNIVRGAFDACRLGYSLDCGFVGRGYMFEALDASIRYLFEEVGLHRVEANYIPSNERSGRLLDRLGFEKEGFARRYLQIAGRWQDHVLTALTREEPAEHPELDPAGFP